MAYLKFTNALSVVRYDYVRMAAFLALCRIISTLHFHFQAVFVSYRFLWLFVECKTTKARLLSQQCLDVQI